MIRELYQKLFDYKIAVIHFFNMELASGNEILNLEFRIKKWSTIVPDFSSYFHRNRVYFSKDLCEIIDKLNNELEKINMDTRTFLQSFQLVEEQIAAIKSKDQRFTYLRNKANGFLEKDIEKITNDLEKEFRKILGVE